MNSFGPIYPKTEETVADFQQRMSIDEEKPIVEMNDETARDMNVIWASIDAIAQRWRSHTEAHIPGMPMNRNALWGFFSQNYEPRPLPVAKEFIMNSHGEGKIALDLGCGNSPIVKPLLQRGWRVIAVDNCSFALGILSRNNQAAIASGQLQVIEADVTTYTPSEPVDLVIAADVLPYIDPSRFRDTWQKIHDTFIKENGFFIGSFFRAATTPQSLSPANVLKDMGAWFLPDRRMVRPLLTQVGYEIITCQFRKQEQQMEPMCIQFIAKKKPIS